MSFRIQIITPDAKSVANRWKAQYHDKEQWYSPERKQIYEQLLIAPNDAKAIAKIIGNDSWVGETCYGCGEKVLLFMEFSQYEVNSDSESTRLCFDCLERAADALRAVKILLPKSEEKGNG